MMRGYPPEWKRLQGSWAREVLIVIPNAVRDLKLAGGDSSWRKR
jgi:hypothetical protein